MTWEDEIRKNETDLPDEVKEAMDKVSEKVTQAFDSIDIETMSSILMPHGKYANIDEFAAAISQKGVESLKRKYKNILGKPPYMRDR